MELHEACPYFIVSPTHVHCVDLSWRLRDVFCVPSNWPGTAFLKRLWDPDLYLSRTLDRPAKTFF